MVILNSWKWAFKECLFLMVYDTDLCVELRIAVGVRADWYLFWESKGEREKTDERKMLRENENEITVVSLTNWELGNWDNWDWWEMLLPVYGWKSQYLTFRSYELLEYYSIHFYP